MAAQALTIPNRSRAALHALLRIPRGLSARQQVEMRGAINEEVEQVCGLDMPVEWHVHKQARRAEAAFDRESCSLQLAAKVH